ncbi:MAG: hemolysin family protein [Actinomycetota bacterium]|nr:hemolysin family protein [Actinomycetota bacterium]
MLVAWIVAFALMIVAAILRAGGASLIRTPRADALHAASEGTRGAETIARVLEERSEIQPALGTVVMLFVVLSVILMTWALTEALSGIDVGVALFIMALGLVLVVDILPRWVGRNRPGALAYRSALALSIAVRLGSAVGDLIADPDTDDSQEHQDDSDAEERELILSVLEFTDTIVREVMVPRTDMVTIDASASTDDAVDLVLSSGRSRIPVTDGGVDHVKGIIYSRDLLELFDQEVPARSVGTLSHEAYFVPETKAISHLLREMQASQQHLAIVIDEFGGTAGLVTIEDLIEEIVGEIADEYDDEEPMVVEIDGAWLVDARLDVDDLAELVGVDLPSDEWDTVGGLVLELAGRVPKEGETFDHDGLQFTAAKVQGRRVAKVRVSRM